MTHSPTQEAEGRDRPVRLQLSRKAGLNLQAHSRAVNGLPAVNVARPTIFGNPILCQSPYGCPRHPEFEREAWEEDDGNVDPFRCCVDAYQEYVETGLRGEPTRSGRLSIALEAVAGYPRRSKLVAALPNLRGHNLACWCALDAPCHADVLLRLANPIACDDPTPAPTDAAAAHPHHGDGR